MPPKSPNGVGVGGNKGIIRGRQSSSDNDSPSKPPLKKAGVGDLQKSGAHNGVVKPSPSSTQSQGHDALMSAIKNLEKKFDTSIEDHKNFRVSIESRLKNMQQSINERITVECKSVKEELQIDIQVLNDRVNAMDAGLKKMKTSMEKEMEDLKARLAELEKSDESLAPFNPDITIVATGIRHNPGENLQEKAEKFVKEGLGLDDVPVVDAMRTPHRNNRPGIVKIQFESRADKEKALSRRFELKDTQNYKRVYIRSSMSHVERLIHLNTKALLQASGAEKDYKILSSGRMVKKDVLQQWFGNKEKGDQATGGNAQDSVDQEDKSP